MYEIFGDTAAAVLLATTPGDSIRRVAQRIHVPYETVRGAVDTLETAGFVRYDDGLYVTDARVRDAARGLLAASARVNPPTVEEAYVLPQFTNHPFAFARADAVYLWTGRGSQPDRTADDYPIYLAVRNRDVEHWESFLESFGLPVALDRQPADAVDGSIQFVLDPRSDLDVEWVDGYPVVPLAETVTFAREHAARFQPALATLADTYDDVDSDAA